MSKNIAFALIAPADGLVEGVQKDYYDAPRVAVGITVAIYEKDYRALLERTQRELPGVRLAICEPFVLRCGAVNDKWFPEFDGYRAAARRVATDFHATFVPFQAMFDKAVKVAQPQHWAADGVHPTLAGASLMVQTWLATVSKV